MCGRFTLTQSAETVAEVFDLAAVPPLTPRYNIAPTQSVAAVLLAPERRYRELKMLRWGLIPAWAKDAKIGARTINARSETVTEKPAFRTAFLKRRCLVIADGFYEWERRENAKQPFYFRLKNGKPFAFAGLWECWQPADGEAILSCTILTAEANELVRPIHDRMPVILDPTDWEQWLNPEVRSPELLRPLLRPHSALEMTAYPVSTRVNSPSNDSDQCVSSL